MASCSPAQILVSGWETENRVVGLWVRWGGRA